MMKIADMHCDTLYRLYAAPGSRLQDATGHLHLHGLEQGGYILQNFAAYMERCGEPFNQLCNKMIDIYESEVQANSHILAPARNWDEIENNIRADKISAVLTVEGGEAIEGDLDRIAELYNRGVRMLNLCWQYRNELAAPNFSPTEGDTSGVGLSKLGIEALEEMERLGIIPDVSHLSDAGFKDLVQHTKKPFAASHSNARSLTDHQRNMTDEMIRTLADRGGVIGLNFYAPFLGCDSPCYEAAIRHLRYIRNIAGEDVLTLGSDFDGINDTGEFLGAQAMQSFVAALERAGFGESCIEKITHKNLLDFYKRTLV